MGFQKDFVWGCATSAYQIEGGAREDGRTDSIWDVFCREKGRISADATGEQACDFYHRYKDDIALMKLLGIKAYRFSLSWSRIFPEGVGTVNEKGLQFYDRVVDELLKADITPYITLYHWDLPHALYKKGGWLNEDCVTWFGNYAGFVAEHFSDRISHFITFNEPQCFIGMGHLSAVHAPGTKLSLPETFQMAHNVLKAHGNAVVQMRKRAVRKIQIGYAPTCSMTIPQTETEKDIRAAREYLFRCPDELSEWTWNVAWFSDPVFLGHYPKEGVEKYKEYLPLITEADMELIFQPLDFMGENIYNAVTVREGENGEPEALKHPDGFARTANGWPITPDCMYWGPLFLTERYHMPLYITENGMANYDHVAVDGRVHDTDRIDFMNAYLSELKSAVEHGVDIRGYFAWSFLDNFEWNRGYQDRFGLVYVDYDSGRRIAKDSAFWYRTVIESNGETLKFTVAKEIIFMKPVYKQMVWGGDKMADEYSYHTPGEKTGECWAISAHENGDCMVRQGKFKGMHLSELWRTHKELFGYIKGEKFPLLVKVIDAKEDLSIQVHPDDTYANEQEHGSMGKTECWYILDCRDDATLVVGHHAKSKEELRSMIAEGRWKDFLCEVPIRKGDFIQINPGTVHAIKGNTMILETQQNSDITYRLYDYDRLTDGEPRELHIRKSEDVITVPTPENPIRHTGKDDMELLIQCDYYKVWKYTVTHPMVLNQDEPFLIMTVTNGNGFVDGLFVRKGDHFILPYQYGLYTLEGDMEIIASTVISK